MHRCPVTLPHDLIEQIDRMVGEERRDQYIEEAVRETIRARRVAAFEQVVGSLKDIDIPGWESPESTVEWVRRMRDGTGEPWLPTDPLPDSR